MKRQGLAILFGLEVIFAVQAGLVFSLISDRMMAALVAGIGFLAVGLVGIYKSYSWSERLRMPTYWLIRIHLYLFALPMLVVRIIFWGHDWKELHFLSIPGPVMHQYSAWVYWALMAATAFDWWKARRSGSSNGHR